MTLATTIPTTTTAVPSTTLTAAIIFRLWINRFQSGSALWLQGVQTRDFWDHNVVVLAMDIERCPIDHTDEAALYFTGDGLLLNLCGSISISSLLRKLDLCARCLGWMTFLRICELGTFDDVRGCVELAARVEEEGAHVLPLRTDRVYRAEIAAAARRRGRGNETDEADAVNAAAAAAHFGLAVA